MGLTIHYSGSFNHQVSLSEMIEEVKDIAEIYNWHYHIFEKQFPENSSGKDSFDNKIYGIYFTPPNCETVCLSFLSNGKISSVTNLKLYGDLDNPEYSNYLYMLSVKTQFAGVDTHKLIVHLLKYLSKKYFTDFKVNDEGEYWETGNEELLKNIFSQYNALMDVVSSAIENCPIDNGETFEQYFERILKRNNKKRNGE